jgi:hypothetical protein
LYINERGILEIIDHNGKLVPQRTGMVGSNDVFDESQYGGENITEVLNVIIDIINGLSTPDSVVSVNGESGIVILNADKIDLSNFFALSIGDSIRNGVYRRSSSGDFYERVDVANQAQNSISKVNGNNWTILHENAYVYQATGQAADPTLVTDWSPYGGGPSVSFSVTPLYSGSTQRIAESIIKSLEEAKTIIYNGSSLNVHMDAVYTASTSNGNWIVYPTSDGSGLGSPIFSDIISVIPTSFSNTLSTIASKNTTMMSGSCYSMPSGANADNGTIVQVSIKGIRT